MPVRFCRASEYSRSLERITTKTPHPLTTLLRRLTLDILLLRLLITITMFRTAVLQSIRCAAQAGVRAAPRVQRPAFKTASFVQPRIPAISAVRSYASASSLSNDEVTGRILDLLKNFDKVRQFSRFGGRDI